jgi:hypothetical protein
MIKQLHDGFWRPFLWLGQIWCAWTTLRAVMVLSNYSLLHLRWFLETIFQNFGVSNTSGYPKWPTISNNILVWQLLLIVVILPGMCRSSWLLPGWPGHRFLVWGRLRHGTLAGTLWVGPGTMYFTLLPGLIRGCLGFFQEVPGHFQEVPGHSWIKTYVYAYCTEFPCEFKCDTHFVIGLT